MSREDALKKLHNLPDFPGTILMTATDPNREYCCEIMEEQLTYHCDQHGDGWSCPDVVIGLIRSQGYDNHYTLIARNAEYICNFCPWCGADLKNWKQE